MPEHDDTVRVIPEPSAFGAFDHSYAINDTGTVRIVPTPGHTRGHQSLMIRDAGQYILLAGDVIFDVARLQQQRALAGIVESVAAARQSIRTLERQMSEFDTVVEAAHDGSAMHGVEESSAETVQRE